MRASRLLRAAGGHGHYKPLLKDPAIERWHQMREDMYKGFTLTRENALPTLTLALVIPVGLYFAIEADLNRGWEFRGTTADVSTQRALRKPEDLQAERSLPAFFGQYDEVKTA